MALTNASAASVGAKSARTGGVIARELAALDAEHAAGVREYHRRRRELEDERARLPRATQSESMTREALEVHSRLARLRNEAKTLEQRREGRRIHLAHLRAEAESATHRGDAECGLQLAPEMDAEEEEISKAGHELDSLARRIADAERELAAASASASSAGAR